MAKVQTGIAGEFWFFSQLHRLGYEAYITLGNTKAIDISLKLKDQFLTFDVKSKINFGGSFMYLKVPERENHFVVFVDLKARKEKSGIIELPGEPSCYIVKSEDLHYIAHHWKADKSDAKGYGFNDKILWYLKHKDEKSITKGNIEDFKLGQKIIGEIDFDFYNQIIWTLADFEKNYYNQK